MPDDSDVITSLTDDITIGPTAWTALLVAQRYGLYMKFIGIDGQDLVYL
ncbi:hypothetical protein ACNPIS_23030 [Paenibacillus apiarius]